MPALAVATSVAGERRQFQLGCDEDARFRIASITKPMTASLAVQLLDLDESTGIWPDDVRVRHLLAHVTGYGGEIGDLSALRRGRRRARGGGRRAAVGRTARPARRCLVLRQHGLLARGLAGRAAERLDLRGGAARARARAGRAHRRDLREPSLAGTGPGAGGGDYPRARRPSGGVVATAADVGRFADWQLQNAWTNALRVPLAKPPAGVYGLGFFGERVGGDRRLGPPGLLRRLPVLAPARPEPRRLVRRPDEQRPRQPGAARDRGRLVRGAARCTSRRGARRPSSSSRRRSHASAAPTRTRT